MMFLTALVVFAYIGPGLGGGFIAAILGLVISFFLALFAILWYPIKKIIGKSKKKSE